MAKCEKVPKNDYFFAVAMATAVGRIPKLCMLVGLEVLYICHLCTKARYATAQAVATKVCSKTGFSGEKIQAWRLLNGNRQAQNLESRNNCRYHHCLRCATVHRTCVSNIKAVAKQNDDFETKSAIGSDSSILGHISKTIRARKILTAPPCLEMS